MISLKTSSQATLPQLMLVVLDSNVLLVAIGKRSRYRPIWSAFVEGKFEIGLCQEILHEYEEVIGVHGAPGAFEIIANILTESPDVVFKHIYYKWEVITADPDDNKFLILQYPVTQIILLRMMLILMW